MTLLREQTRTLLDRALSTKEERFDRLAEIAGIDPARDLRFADLREVDFAGSVLVGWDFTGADLRGASFHGACVTKCVFTNALGVDLTGAAVEPALQTIMGFDWSRDGSAELHKSTNKGMLRTIAAFDRIGEENAFAVLARATELAAGGRDIINLGIGQPDFRTPDHIVEAAVKALRDGHHGYTPATGILALREAVAADLLRRFAVKVSPDEVMIMPGGKPTMFMSILMFGEPGTDILYPDPGFPIYRSMIEFTGARPVPVPVREANGFAFSAEETLSLITPQTRLLILNSPANPTGGVTPRAEIDRLVAGLDNHPDVAVMSDEIYDQMVYDGETHVCLLSYPSIRDRLILLNGWSKTYAMTGWRLGYAVWPGKLYDYARKLAVNLHSCVNAAAQYAGLAALTGPQDAVHRMVDEFDARRRVVVEGLNRLPGVTCVTPKGAFYAFPNIRHCGWKAKPLAAALLEDAGVAVVGGPDFGILGEGYVRLSYANSTENIRKALDRMGDFLVSRKAA